ncbi:DUF305 domain-containing protein [Adhaeribacter aquaticus]|uniref:DUF305 domain-containing protein n=1 Tax=Adhaeribacter aquaticus TaxID=299567 RepID=UPI000557E468|nr:DUF305 domain-containing protein [Adhaeribacter aquaticus]
MKNLLTFRPWAILLFVSLILPSCMKEEGLELQPHDDNKMMSIMHAMMDEMHKMSMTDDPDVAFAKMMIMHHQGAINMANEELNSGDDATIKGIATKIKADQQKEIQDLQAFITSYQPDQPTSSKFNMELMDSMEKSSRQSDLQIITGDTDHDFSQLMIVHHQSAIENAYAVLEHGTSPTIKTMAHMMIDAQVSEIKQLQEWLLANKPEGMSGH